MASSVLLAAISVMPYDHKHGAHNFELENDKERSLRITSLLGFSLDPKKDTKEMVGYFKEGAQVCRCMRCLLM
jgi:translation initiation factor 3 subunit A